jgi:MFS family permease
MNSSMVAVTPRARSDSNANTKAALGRTTAPASTLSSPDIIETDIPARLDALPWGRFHSLVVVALGVTWILDGLEVTMTGALSGVFKETTTLGLSNTEIGLAATIGGEYTAINSTIQELIPARVRGWTDLIINGSFWVGAAMGAVAAIVLLDPAVIDLAFGWRFAFLIGAVLGLVIVIMRLWIPESPRWLMIHGDAQRAETIVSAIEERLGLTANGGEHDRPRVRLHRRAHTSLAEVGRALFRTYRQRTLVGITLMAAQAFFYNAIFFTYALVLTDFYAVPANLVGWYILPFAAGNFLGPLLLGRLFDTVGRRIMIGLTYAVSGVLLAGAGFLFSRNLLSAQGLTVAWMVIFFFASAAASSAYLTVSETFPLEIRALAIAFFYAVGTGIGGAGGPWLLGVLIDTGSRDNVAAGYLLGAVLMVFAACVEWSWGVDAERRPLEAISRPLAFVE